VELSDGVDDGVAATTSCCICRPAFICHLVKNVLVLSLLLLLLLVLQVQLPAACAVPAGAHHDLWHPAVLLLVPGRHMVWG
jgi:hypothetical protein